jgi:hypothetical protein
MSHPKTVRDDADAAREGGQMRLDDGRLMRWGERDEAPGYDAAVLNDDYQPRNAVSSIEITRASKRLLL